MDQQRRNLLFGGSLVAAAIAGGLGPTMCAWSRMDRNAALRSSTAPRRPSGRPAPLLDEDIAPVLARLDAWYAAHLDPDIYKFNPPASEAQIDRLEALVGLELPQSFRQLYRWHDGENDDRWGHIYGLPLLPLQQVARDWTDWKRVLAGFGGNRYPVPGAGWPLGAVDPAYVNPRRIPLTADGSGNNIGLDFDPWPGGRFGQVIIYGRNEDVKVVLAESLGGFLGWIAALLEGGNFRLRREPGEIILREFRLRSPAADHFHEGARQLLGAPGPFL